MLLISLIVRCHIHSECYRPAFIGRNSRNMYKHLIPDLRGKVKVKVFDFTAVCACLILDVLFLVSLLKNWVKYFFKLNIFTPLYRKINKITQ